MDRLQKSRVLARLEGQLHRWGFGRDPATALRHVVSLLRILQSLPDSSADSTYLRRLTGIFSTLLQQRHGTSAFRACVTLARVDCLLWQKHLSFRPRLTMLRPEQDVTASDKGIISGRTGKVT